MTLILICLLVPLSVTLAQSTVFVEPDFFDVQVTNQLSQPTTMEFAPDGRLFVLQQNGTVRIIENDVLLPTPFMSIPVHNTGERGLLGIAFDPNFAVNNFLYVYYTTLTTPRHNRISRFTADGNVVVPGSEFIVLDIDNLGSATNHNGGQLGFGLDGLLYAAVGDAGFDSSNAQNRTNLFGSILRINPNGTIPLDNPFYDILSGKNRAIWAYGLRNPFVFDIQPGTGRMHINDVGQQSVEEIDVGQAGANYGWPILEGNTGGTPPAGYVAPIYTYSSSSGPNCAITGGAFYNPPTEQFPLKYVGDYFFADYCSRRIWAYDIATDTASLFASNTLSALVDLEVGPDGSLYYIAYGSHAVSRIFYAASIVPPTISVHPEDAIVAVGETAQFSCSAAGTVPITYQWQRDNVDIPGADSNTYITPPTVLGDDGAQFRCVADNSASQPATSNAAILTVVDGTSPLPEIAIDLPDSAAPPLYEAGETLLFTGSYADPDPADADLPDSAFDWQIDFHHGTHMHPFQNSLPDRQSGSVTIDSRGHTETDVWYRVYLTVTDTTGLSNTVFVDVFPLVSEVQLHSIPTGLTLTLDGQPGTTPIVANSVSGVERIIGGASTQALSGMDYTFTHWDHGGPLSQVITIPPTNTTYIANYLESALISPLDAAPPRNHFDIAMPTLTWSQISWAVAYQVQVATQSNFSGIVYDSGDLSADSFAVTTPALADGVYYWRVRAKRPNGTYGGWSQRDSFTIRVP